METDNSRGYEPSEWIFGWVAGWFATTTAVTLTCIYVVFMAKAWSAHESLKAKYSESWNQNKMSIASRLLKVPGVNPASVAEFLASNEPNFPIQADTAQASRDAEALISDFRESTRAMASVNVLGINITQASMGIVTIGWMIVMCPVLAVCGRRSVDIEYFK